MPSAVKTLAILGSLNAAVAVILGAFGAHALKARLSGEMLTAFQTGVQYHFFHAIGLFLVAFGAFQLPGSTLVKWSGSIMFVGILLFCGSLYLLALTGIRWFGAVTPLGGLGFIVSWVLLALAWWRG